MEEAVIPEVTLYEASKPLPRICMLIPSFYPLVGGAERQAQRLSRHLIRKGLSVFILTRRLPGTDPLEILDGIPINRTPALTIPVFLLSSFLFLLRNRARYDIVHVHTLNSPALVAGLVKLLLRKKILLKVPRGGGSSVLGCLRSTILGRVRLRFLRWTVDKWIAISGQIRSELIEAGIPTDRIAVIPNGVDTDTIVPVSNDEERVERRRQVELPSDAFIAVFVGRLIQRKRVDLLLEVWKDLIAQYPQAYLLVLGDGDERSKLQRTAVADGTDHQVRFLGELQPEEVVKYLQLSDVFVLPSESEGLSNALLEAMSVGLAPIATRIGGNTDVINDGDNGLLFEVGDKAGLTKVLVRCLRDMALRQRIGTRARRTIEERFSLDAISERYVGLYQSLV